jgi:hypothetical protein
MGSAYRFLAAIAVGKTSTAKFILNAVSIVGVAVVEGLINYGLAMDLEHAKS